MGYFLTLLGVTNLAKIEPFVGSYIARGRERDKFQGNSLKEFMEWIDGTFRRATFQGDDRGAEVPIKQLRVVIERA